MLKFTLWKIRQGKKEQWLEWCNELNERRKEALETLVEENLIREQCVVFDDYVFYYHESYDGGKQPMNLDKEINRKHAKMMKDCLWKPRHGQEGYNFVNYKL